MGRLGASHVRNFIDVTAAAEEFIGSSDSDDLARLLSIGSEELKTIVEIRKNC